MYFPSLYNIPSFSSTIPLICVCDKPAEDDPKTRPGGGGGPVLRPLQSLQNTGGTLRRLSQHSQSQLYKSLSSASTSSDTSRSGLRLKSDPVISFDLLIKLLQYFRIKPKAGSDENLLSAKTTNIRQSFLKTTQAEYPPSSSYSPSSVLSTSSSLRLSTQNNSPQSKVAIIQLQPDH